MNISTIEQVTENWEAIDTDDFIIHELEKLPKDYWDFKNADTQELTHGLHSYPAMMIYPISRKIIQIMKKVISINSLLDPFTGSGTVLVEGVLAGIKNIYGQDLNPLSQLLTSVKIKSLDIESLNVNYEKLQSIINSKYIKYIEIIKSINEHFSVDCKINLTAKEGWGNKAPEYLKKYYKEKNIDLSVPNFKNIGYWFKPSVIIELQIIKDMIKEIEDLDSQNFFWVAFSETIRLVSNKRNGEFKMFRMNPEQVALFNPDVRKEFYIILQRNINKMHRYSELCAEVNTVSNVKMVLGNSANLDKIPDQSIDLVITSPPYGDSKTTVAYGEYSRLSLQWLDLFNLTDKDILSIDKRLVGGEKYRNGFEYNLNSKTLSESLNKIKNMDLERSGDVYSFYKDLDKVIEEVSKKTKLNGYHFWVVGNRTVKNENLKTNIIITELAEQYGMKHVYTIDRNISSKVMPSQNSPSNKIGEKVTTMVNEHIVVLRKTASKLN